MTTPTNKSEQPTTFRKQLHRLVQIVELLNSQQWVTMPMILNRLSETEFQSGPYLGCCNRTIQRDIKTLQDEYHAPIAYDRHECAYRLEDRDWTFEIPSMMSQEELLAIVIGGKISQDIFPKAMGLRIEKAVANVLSCNKSAELSTKLIHSLKVLTDETPATVSDDVFQLVFDAWRTRHLLRIKYSDKGGKAQTRDVEPHTLVFHDMRWSIKGFCHLRNEPRTFLISRIIYAMQLDATFTPRQDIIDSVTPDGFMDYEKTKDVTIWLNEAGRQFAAIHSLHSRQSILQNDDGSYLMYVPAVATEQLIPWILRQRGNARPESPPAVVEAVREAIRHLADVCQAYPKEEIRTKLRS